MEINGDALYIILNTVLYSEKALGHLLTVDLSIKTLSCQKCKMFFFHCI